MAGRVFLSCGQATDEERTTSRLIADVLRSEGFNPYVATEIQTILDLNREIIQELKQADYYFHINFRREKLGDSDEFRGSLFAHQEFALAYGLGFDKMLFLSQTGVRKEGMLAFIVSNTQKFEDHTEAVEAAKRAIKSAGWVPSYSRNLIARRLRWGPRIQYGDHTGQAPVQVLYADIVNRRSDLGAIGTVARLSTIVERGQQRASLDRSHLKATGYPGYEQTIFPGSHGAFDLLALRLDRPHTVTLNSALDVSPRSAILSRPGEYTLQYEVFANAFPVLSFGVHLRIRDLPVRGVFVVAEAGLVSEDGPLICSADTFAAN
jgi:hypothetical protein